MNSARETFSKQERLCSIKAINSLFEDGCVFYTSLFKVVWKINHEADIDPFPVKVAFSVPKKGFPHAVIRNLLKRRMRESYRRNKSRLYTHLSGKKFNISLFFILRTKTIPDYGSIEKSVNDAINRVISQI